MSGPKAKSPTPASASRATQLAAFAASIGVALLFTGIPLAVVSFNRHNPLPYSCWNHVISELGFPFALPLTWLYDATLAIASLTFLPTFQALRAHLRTRMGNVAAGFGIAACAALCGIGILGLSQDIRHSPYIFMRFLQVHMALAEVFFLGCAVAVTLFTIAFCRHRTDPASRIMVLVGIAGCLVYTSALIAVFYPNQMQAALLRDLRDPAFQARSHSPRSVPILTPWLDLYRPHIWWVAALEWLWAWSILFWLVSALVFLRRKTTPQARRFGAANPWAAGAAPTSAGQPKRSPRIRYTG